jgi:hypothetical protein
MPEWTDHLPVDEKAGDIQVRQGHQIGKWLHCVLYEEEMTGLSSST